MSLSVTVAAKRSRTSTPRSKAGCLVCRIRHVKCGEEKPFCRRCISAGRKCSGYTDASSPPLPILPNIKKYEIPFQVPGTQIQRRVLHYFCVQASQALAGFSRVAFWERTVLRHAHGSGIVRTCLTTLAYAHLEHSSKSKYSIDVARLKPSADAILQYDKALRQLRKYLDSELPSKTIVLICCLLMAVHDFMWSARDQAVQHVDNGLQILRQMSRDTKVVPSKLAWYHHETDIDEFSQLQEVFNNLDVELTGYYDDRVALPLEVIDWPLDFKPFHTIEEGRLAAQRLEFGLRQLRPSEFGKRVVHIQKDGMAFQNKLLLSLESFDRALGHLITTVEWGNEYETGPGNSLLTGVTALQINGLELWKEFEGWRPRDADDYVIRKDAVDIWILDLCASLLEPQIGSPFLHSFTLAPTTINPLYDIMRKTKDMNILRRACDLLEVAAHRKEGLLNTGIILVGARGLRDFRERGGSADETHAVISRIFAEYRQTKPAP